MATITMRPYQGEADLEAIANLINLCDEVDKLDQGVSISELRTDFNAPSMDQARDIRLWHDSDDQLIGFGNLWISEPSETIDGYLSFYVHPSIRGGGLETEIIKWSQERMREVRQERGVSVRLRSGARDYRSDRIRILENHGFQSERYFFTMERNLALAIEQPKFPQGFTLRHMNGEQDAQAWVELHNQSFIDHWNYHPLTVENHQHWLNEPTYRPELDLIVTAFDGTFAAYCHCHISLEDNARTGRNEGWVGILGTRRGFRRMGLGRAMLLSGLRRLQAEGIDTARLGVDADNPNGALPLYQSVGFHKLYTNISYFQDV
ncbi:GNAT family N-acetyltransferase [Iningainema tapete]|uniref:GNAT family N-acetyltransferase n=1 Tax=Iningainema tapete BLCC-T55 TaxID=2748662 RepID=A0A8J6XIY2_9CYAN|nr:GNAT family N-acetyltransferase [Iningainema tapete]MBD2771591.1 GNAT family N-acetyltransferase [Iningainema tapete BLCC-T55]